MAISSTLSNGVSTKKPAYVFVPGVSLMPVHYEPAIKILAKKGYEATCVKMPTCGTETSSIQNKTFDDEMSEIRRVCKHYLDDKNQNVVLVMHGSGGIPGALCVKGLDEASRRAEGKSTFISELVGIGAYYLPEGFNMSFLELPDWISQKGDCRRPNIGSIPILFAEIDETKAKQALENLQWQRNSFGGPTYEGTPWDLPLPKTAIMYMYKTDPYRKLYLDMLGSVFDETWSVKSIKADAVPSLSRPEELVAVLTSPNY